MNTDSSHQVAAADPEAAAEGPNAATTNPDDTRPILIVPYMWLGDFVRGHTVVRVLKQRWPNRPIDLLTTSLAAPLVDYMPGVRTGIEWNLPRRSLPLGQYRALAHRIRQENYGTALVMLRTWKSALAPFLAGIPERTGFVGMHVRFGNGHLGPDMDEIIVIRLFLGSHFY